MLYRHPGKYELHGDKFDYIIVEEVKVDHYLKHGWYMTTAEALAKKHKHDEPEPEPLPVVDVDRTKPKRSYTDLSVKERLEVGSLDLGLYTISDHYHVTVYAVRKCRNELHEGKLNK